MHGFLPPRRPLLHAWEYWIVSYIFSLFIHIHLGARQAFFSPSTTFNHFLWVWKRGYFVLGCRLRVAGFGLRVLGFGKGGGGTPLYCSLLRATTITTLARE